MRVTCDLLSEWDSVRVQMPAACWDVYMSEGYHRLYASPDMQPVAFLLRARSDVYLLPCLVKRCHLEGVTFVSAYGYGGPAATSAAPEFLHAVSKTLDCFMRDMGVLRAQLRLHPVLANVDLLGPEWTVTFSRKTAGVDLSQPEEAIVAKLHPKHRNMVSRAEREGLQFIWDTNTEYLGEFAHLYDLTMARLSAEPAYFYSADFYATLVSGLGDRLRIGVVRDADQVVAAALFLVDGEYGHYHLSASCPNAPVGAGQYLVFRSALELKGMGIRTLHLGGGTTQHEDDTLLRFKSRFGELRFDFYTASWTHQEMAPSCCREAKE